MQASLNARRRGATAADDVDVRDAYTTLLDRRPRPVAVDVTCEAGLVGAGALIGYGMTLLTSATAIRGPGWVVLLTGCAVGLFCAVLKHTKMR